MLLVKCGDIFICEVRVKCIKNFLKVELVIFSFDLLIKISIIYIESVIRKRFLIKFY